MKYVSFVYDCPYVLLYSYQLKYPTNYVFLFDSYQYRELYEGGLENVYYMILPTDPDVIDEKLKSDYDEEKLVSDISFMGQLYDEQHNYYDMLCHIWVGFLLCLKDRNQHHMYILPCVD